MVSTFFILAEVADKEPTVMWLWTVSAIISVVSFALCRWRRWAAVIAIPAAVIWMWILLPEINDPLVGPAILEELGRSYVMQTYFAAFMPLLFLALGLTCKSREPSNQAKQPT